jgi:hypothetical protein
VVAVRRKRHGELGLARRVLTEAHEIWVERGFTASEADAESAMRIELGQPTRNDVEPKLVAGLRGVAVSTRQIAAVRERDGYLPRRARIERGRNRDLVDEDIQTGGAVEYVEPRWATAQLPMVSLMVARRGFHLPYDSSCHLVRFPKITFVAS